MLDNKYLVRAAKSASPKEVARLISKAGGVVCGGAVRDIIVGDTPSDIDVFVPESVMGQWRKALRTAGFNQKRNTFISNVDSSIVIDLVGTNKRTASSIVEDFDCNVCQWWMRDGKPVPLNNEVLSATKSRVATFNTNDKFNSSKRRANKLTNRGWKVLAQDNGWERYPTSTEEEAERHFDRFFTNVITDPNNPKRYEDVGGDSFQEAVGYDEIAVRKFSVPEDTEIQDIDQEARHLSKGEHAVTVERRYGVIDAWLDDEYHIIDVVPEGSNPEETFTRVMSEVDAYINNIGLSSEERVEQDWICACGENNETGYPCWKCGGPESGAVGHQPKRAMKFKEARKLASDMARQYFNNGIELPVGLNKLINKQSAGNPKLNDEIWAELMTRAIMSFHEGLEDRIDERNASKDIKVYEQAVDLVGTEAFNTIAYIVSTAALNKIQGRITKC